MVLASSKMYEESRRINGGTMNHLQERSFSNGGVQGYITYKRRKYVKTSISSGTDQQTDKTHAHHLENYEYKPQLQSPMESQINVPTDSQKFMRSSNSDKEHEGIILDESRIVANNHNVPSISEQCQSVFLDIIASDKFVSLCSLLCESFRGIKADNIFDFSLINSRMKNGEYELSSALFALDIQQIWENFKKIGGEIVHLANSLSIMSHTSFQKQVQNSTLGDCGQHKHEIPEDISQVGSAYKGSVILNPTKQIISYNPDQTNKPEQNESRVVDKVSTCRKCGSDTNPTHSLICDSCEAVYHISCIEPVTEIPIRSWYCGACYSNRKDSLESQDELARNPHKNCVVCDKLTDSRTETFGTESNSGVAATMISISSEESSDCCSKEVGWQRGFTKKGNRPLCKRCKTGEQEGMELLVCQHSHCPYKYYHKRCLRTMEIEKHGPVWFCPSCLCRGCLTDKDDDKMVLCDGCDEAYHIYCMVPPRSNIPRGDWYCIFCNIEIRVRQRRLGRNGAKGLAAGSMDILLCAAEKLHSEGM